MILRYKYLIVFIINIFKSIFNNFLSCIDYIIFIGAIFIFIEPNGFSIFCISYLFIISIYLLFKYLSMKSINKYITNSTLIVGAKGSGKDLITQNIVYSNYKKHNFLSVNVDYGYNTEVVSFNDFKLKNSYLNFINNNLLCESLKEDFEGKSLIISDCGIYLPSQYDKELSKAFGWLPIFIALSRHLYDMPIIANVQHQGRIWVKLREQFDFYIKCKNTKSFKVPILHRFLITRCICYENLIALDNGVLPFSSPIGLISQNNPLYSTSPSTMKKIFENQHGFIKEIFFITRKKKIKYDTRHFKKLLTK